MAEATETGTVKWFDDKKGSGYIVPDNGGQDWYVNFRAIQTANPKDFKTLAQGQKVEFERTDANERHIADRLEAKNVRAL